MMVLQCCNLQKKEQKNMFAQNLNTLSNKQKMYNILKTKRTISQNCHLNKQKHHK